MCDRGKSQGDKRKEMRVTEKPRKAQWRGLLIKDLNEGTETAIFNRSMKSLFYLCLLCYNVLLVLINTEGETGKWKGPEATKSLMRLGEKGSWWELGEGDILVEEKEEEGEIKLQRKEGSYSKGPWRSRWNSVVCSKLEVMQRF